ncbi:hypothetical protein SAMN02745136_04325 [Anaerocolumna jejuensis DSM 15929]|uniref:Uncharacterized protein n=1 Tax=Anaerocolumna jejuensis DSM 15929 TaxID=1121322 RepID=A0A1M6YNC7_9FIRM|nr:hypothetical protein [Anaerocolumna jejuensis]SHL19831.1 hypothetical protein SAMN02745136_04325 [Anaerocolumna jejuensis DSM 15929]
MTPNNNVYFGKNAFEQLADSLLCDEYFKNEDMLAGPLDTYGSCVVSVGTNIYYIQEYLNHALGYCPDMQIMIESLKQAYKKEDEALQRLVEFQGGYFFDANRKALLNKDFRVELAGLVRKVGQCYNDAVFLASHFEIKTSDKAYLTAQGTLRR